MKINKIFIIVTLIFNSLSAQTNTAVSKNTNPNISVIGDFQGLYHSEKDRNLDLFLNEIEFALYSNIDPYARADFFFAFHKEQGEDEFHAALEEAFLTSLSLPFNLQLKAGRFRNSFGKSNLLHPHSKGYIDNPAVFENYFGEALIDEGLSINWLIPNPFDFYQDLTLELTRGPAENNSFMTSEKNEFLFTGHIKNFWDLTDNATLELGLSAASGNNDTLQTTQLAAVDITYKWKPLQFNTYQSFEIQGEFLWSNRQEGSVPKIKSFGAYIYSSYQFAQRWFLRTRIDYSNLPDDDSFIERSFTGIIGWNATEFQKIEVQFKQTTSNRFDNFKQLMLRSIFVIGAHGAHQY